MNPSDAEHRAQDSRSVLGGRRDTRVEREPPAWTTDLPTAMPSFGAERRQCSVTARRQPGPTESLRAPPKKKKLKEKPRASRTLCIPPVCRPSAPIPSHSRASCAANADLTPRCHARQTVLEPPDARLRILPVREHGPKAPGAPLCPAHRGPARPRELR